MGDVPARAAEEYDRLRDVIIRGLENFTRALAAAPDGRRTIDSFINELRGVTRECRSEAAIAFGEDITLRMVKIAGEPVRVSGDRRSGDELKVPESQRRGPRPARKLTFGNKP